MVNATLDAIKKRRKFMQQNRVLNDRDILVGGILPFAPGLFRSRLEGASLRLLKKILNIYWDIFKEKIG